jgi:hypothetical protein
MLPSETDQAPLSARPAPEVSPIVDPGDVRRAVEDLFDAGADNGLVIRVYGEAGQDSPAALDTFREMLASLQMHDDGSGALGDVAVPTPDRRAIHKALSLLGNDAIQRSILDHVLTTFGRKLIDPLGALLDRTPEGSLMGRLTMLRDIFLAQITGLHLTQESQALLSADVKKLLNNDYLAKVAAHEEEVQRPRVRRLAQQMLQVVGTTFRAALRRWPERGDAMVDGIVSRLPERLRLKAIPPLVKTLVVSAIQNYLWEEASERLEAELIPLLKEHAEVVKTAPRSLDREEYLGFAEFAWTVIEKHC